MDLLHAQHQSVNQTWPVIVTFRPAPLSRYMYIYKVSRAWVGIVGKYKVTKIVCLTQQTAIVSEFEGCTVKVGQATGNCDVTMVVAIGLRVDFICVVGGPLGMTSGGNVSFLERVLSIREVASGIVWLTSQRNCAQVLQT